MREWVTMGPLSLNMVAMTLRGLSQRRGRRRPVRGLIGGVCGRGNCGSRRSRSRRQGQGGDKQVEALGKQASAVAGGEALTALGGRGDRGRRSDGGGGQASGLAEEVSGQIEEVRGRERTGGMYGRGGIGTGKRAGDQAKRWRQMEADGASARGGSRGRQAVKGVSDISGQKGEGCRDGLAAVTCLRVRYEGCNRGSSPIFAIFLTGPNLGLDAHW